MPELTATLIVSTTHSYCGHCRKNTLLHDGQGAPITHHVDICGYSPKPGGGCGARFVDISTDCWGVTPERLREIRPDLPARADEDDEPETECERGDCLGIHRSPDGYQDCDGKSI